MPDPNLKTMIVYGDGVHDDTEAIQAYVRGEARLVYPDGTPFMTTPPPERED